MKILVTGGLGYLGSWIAEYLKKDKHEVRILVKKKPDFLQDWAKTLDVCVADITDEEAVKDCCKDIDIVIHTASVNEIICGSDDRTALMVNGFGTRNMLAAAALQQCQLFIYLSTFHVYGSQNSSTYKESVLPNPTHNYGITHLLGEMYCNKVREKTGLKTVSLRVSNGYGAPLRQKINRWTLVMNDLCKMAYHENKIVLRSSGLQQRDMVSIRDIYQAINHLINKQDEIKYSLYQVGGNFSISMLELAEKIQKVFKNRFHKKIAIRRPSKDRTPEPEIKYDISRIRELGYNPSDRIDEEIDKIFDLLAEK